VSELLREKDNASKSILLAVGLAALLNWSALDIRAQILVAPNSIQQSAPEYLLPGCESPNQDSPYIPVDSWIYPAVMRLYAMGYSTDVYLGMRPWTRSSVLHMLDETSAQIEDAAMYGDSTEDEARNLYADLLHELHADRQIPSPARRGQLQIESSYSVLRSISGTPLRDSFHLGSTIVNDYGRPYEKGFNNYSGLSGYASTGRFLVYLRGEFQYAPSGAGYSTSLAQILSAQDRVPFLDPITNLQYNRVTIPLGPITAAAQADSSRPMSPPTHSATSFLWANRTIGSGPVSVRAWRIVITPRTSIPSESTGSNL
jgi:hypothetical protein